MGLPDSPKSASTFSHPLAWVVLVISLAASVGGWFLSRMHTELGARKQFDEEASRIESALKERMQIYEDVLHGAVGLYAASVSVERSEWQAYVNSVSIDKRFPGIDGVGFIADVPRNQLEEFLRTTRADKRPDFSLRSPGTSNELFIVKYIEPEDRHHTLLGLDLSSDTDRRRVAEKARDTGAAVITDKMLLAEDGRGPQYGFMMMMPVYRAGAPYGTLAERRRNITGWVYARFVTDQLMRGILEGKSDTLDFEVFDGLHPVEPARIFDSDSRFHADHPDYVPQFSEVVPVVLASHDWTLRFSTKPAFDATISHTFNVLVATAGVLISLLLFGIVWSLSRTRERAERMASRMTSALRETNAQLQKEVGDRQRAEQSIKDSEALYHSLVESLPLNILRKNLQGRFTFANQRFCNEVGRSLDQILGKSDKDLFSPELANRHQREDGRVIETGTTLESVEEHPVDGGQTRFVQVIRTPVHDGAGNVIGVLCIFWDVTDRRLAEEELEHERYLLRTLMDNLPDRIYFKDMESRFLRNSRAHLERFGLQKAEDAIGKTDFDFFTEEHARQAYEDEQQLMRTGEAITKEEKETWPDGSATWALSTKMPLRDESGQIVGTFGISRDITDRKRAEEALRQAKEEAEEANRTKSQFLANMSHELRTPLNSVIGFAGILLKNKGGNLRSTDLNFLERVQANGKHLLVLINQILDLSKIEARKVELQLSSVALDALVRETVAQQEGLVRERPVELLAELPERIAPLETDADKLKQVIINLIGNALKFTEHGSVTVRVRTNPENHYPTHIDVIDTGIGIPEEKLGAIFEAFQQADATTSRKYGGTGLGLTISQALCQLIGYRIAATSDVGHGSTFSVVIKPPGVSGTEFRRKMSSGSEAAPAPAGLPVGELRGKQILVIDDELDSRTLLTHMLSEFGCQVIAASSGEQGLRMAHEFRPHLITVDLIMPTMSGSEVIRAIKADPALRDIPVVVVSIVASENRGRLLGVVDVLQKPISREDLLATLQRNLVAARPRVLIVDDDTDTRRLLQHYLEDEATETQMAANGREALDWLAKRSFDLVLLDLMMPEMDGMAVLNEIRTDPRFQHLPVIIITAKELTRAEIEELRRQSYEVLKKADAFEQDLKRLLQRLLRRQPAGAATPPKPSATRPASP